MVVRRSLLAVCCVGPLAACHSPQSDWERATRANTVAAYQTFLTQHPSDARDEQARLRIGQLKDEQAWNQAQIASTAEGYQQYLAAEPQGAHAPEARDQIASRERAAAFEAAQKANTAEALQAFVKKYPNTGEADEAGAALKRLEAYRAELATAHSRRDADRERRELAKRFGKALPEIVILDPDPSAPEYRITSAPMTEQEADAACASLKASHQRCKVIQPGSG
jgi:hypothetical protein